MSTEQINNRSIIRNVLLNSGWVENENQRWFDEDGFVYYEASVYYNNIDMSISVNYKADKEVMYLSIGDRLNNGLDLVIKFDDNLDRLLKAVVSFQDIISSSNYKEHISKILKITPDVYTSVDEDGEELVRVLDNADNVNFNNGEK